MYYTLGRIESILLPIQNSEEPEILRKEREPLELALERLLTEISQLREEAAHVQDSINAINLLVGDEVPYRPFKLTLKKGIRNLPVISMVRTILRDTARPMDVAGIMEVLRECELENIKDATVRTALVRLAEQPDVIRIERGVYQLITTQEEED